MGSRGFWRGLKRRHVYRVAAAYVVVAWPPIQVARQPRKSAPCADAETALYAVRCAIAIVAAQYGGARPAVAELDAPLVAPATEGLVCVPLPRLDPAWAPTRHDPRFQALLKQYSRPVAADPMGRAR